MDDKCNNPNIGVKAIVNRVGIGTDQYLAEILIGCPVNLTVALNV